VNQASLSTRISQGGIVAAAAKAFARLGFSATRVEDILEAAGVARRTFYKHFSGKEDVLSAVYDLATGELLRALRSMPPPGSARGGRAPSPLDVLERGLDLYLDYHVENAPLLKVLVEQAIRSDSPLAAARRQFRADVGALLDAAVRRTTGEAHDPMLYAALISALEGLSLDLLSSAGSPAEVRRAKKVMHLLYTRALLPAQRE
jgi:AcrR family transcriptional regulator